MPETTKPFNISVTIINYKTHYKVLEETPDSLLPKLSIEQYLEVPRHWQTKTVFNTRATRIAALPLIKFWQGMGMRKCYYQHFQQAGPQTL